jgi:hypothetical protein
MLYNFFGLNKLECLTQKNYITLAYTLCGKF